MAWMEGGGSIGSGDWESIVGHSQDIDSSRAKERNLERKQIGILRAAQLCGII